MKYAAFMLVTITPTWLGLSKHEREAFEEEVLGPVFERHAGRVGVRWFDAAAFTGGCSDVVLFEAENPYAYYALVLLAELAERYTLGWVKGWRLTYVWCSMAISVSARNRGRRGTAIRLRVTPKGA